MTQILEGLRNLQQAPCAGNPAFCRGFALIDDSYNSNPRALSQMIHTLSAARNLSAPHPGAGEMLELGPGAAACTTVRRAGCPQAIDIVVGVQGAAREIVRGASRRRIAEARALFFTQVEPASDFVSRLLREGDIVLIKGSRGVHLERMVQTLCAHHRERVS